MEKKTKIVCTIGPATESQEIMEKLLIAGMNVMRLNFSHGDFIEHQKRVVNLHGAVKKTGIAAAILQDLSGPKIRIGNFSTDSVFLKEGSKFTLTTDDIVGDSNRVHVNYSLLPKEVAKGHHIYIHDGRKQLEVLEVKGNDVICKVIVGGDIKGRRGVNLPHSELSISALTPKDKKDLEFGLKNNVDFFALSFVRKPEDIQELRDILDKRGSKAGIVAKIETPQAVQNIQKIIELSDAIMIARGDLAIEIPAEDVPITQKKIIHMCNVAGKPVITATQMLESMIKAPVPTRAEVSDVANAILDGTDAIMLSEETTLGDFPVKSVQVMSRIAKRVEGGFLHRQFLNTDARVGELKKVGESVTASAVRTADRVGAKYLVSFTMSGYSARMMSRHKPTQPIFVFTPNENTFRKTALTFGTHPVLLKKKISFEEAMKEVRAYFIKTKRAVKGDKIVMASGMPFGKSIETNLLLVETV
jgi:pyruvate kinase